MKLLFYNARSKGHGIWFLVTTVLNEYVHVSIILKKIQRKKLSLLQHRRFVNNAMSGK